MIIHSVFRDYTADILQDALFIHRLTATQNRFTIIDRKIIRLYGELLSPLLEEGRYFAFEATEENKTVYKVLEAIDEMITLKSRRNTRLIAVGGGIIQDVACFLSTIIYRGIDWTFVPTTLLAQADSCIGSKSSINYKDYKNLIGAFYPPTEILIYPGFLDTLEKKEYFSGLGEVFKCSIMNGDRSFYESAGRLDAILGRDYEVLSLETEKALSFKKGVIEKDEFDRGYRNIMNYGHTFGHALESASAFEVPHGQGVSAGIILANCVAAHRGLISEKFKQDVQKILLRIIDTERIKPEYLNAEVMLEYMRKDKKFTGNRHSCILPIGNGVKKFSDITDGEAAAALAEVSKVLAETDKI